MIDITLIIMIIIIGIIAGIIVGALYTVLSIMWNMRKARKDYEQGKRLFEIKETSKKNKKELKVPKPLEDTEPPKENTYKKDFKKFKRANKELEKAKKKYEKGKITHQELKNIFESYQNQDYYKRILKENGKKE